MRVVSLACSNTEIAAALGCGSWLVGLDAHSDWPEEVVAGLPRVGKELAIDVEAVARLRPDLVLASRSVPGHERVVEALARAGLPMLVLEPVSLRDVARDIRIAAVALGVRERGEAVAADFLERTVGRRVDAPALGRPRVLVEWWPRPVIAPGASSWVTDLLDLAGAVNPLGDRPVRSTPLYDDEAARLDPDAVVISWCGVPPRKYRSDLVMHRTGWQGVAAVRTGQVHLVPEGLLGRPGPRLAEGFEALRRIVAGLPPRGEEGRTSGPAGAGGGV